MTRGVAVDFGRSVTTQGREGRVGEGGGVGHQFYRSPPLFSAPHRTWGGGMAQRLASRDWPGMPTPRTCRQRIICSRQNGRSTRMYRQPTLVITLGRTLGVETGPGFCLCVLLCVCPNTRSSRWRVYPPDFSPMASRGRAGEGVRDPPTLLLPIQACPPLSSSPSSRPPTSPLNQQQTPRVIPCQPPRPLASTRLSPPPVGR